MVRRRGRVAEGAPLLREYRVYSSIEGSNPSVSAIILFNTSLYSKNFLFTVRDAPFSLPRGFGMIDVYNRHLKITGRP